MSMNAIRAPIRPRSSRSRNLPYHSSASSMSPTSSATWLMPIGRATASGATVQIDSVRLLDDVAAVDDDGLAGDVARLVRAEEGDQRRDLLGRPRSPDRRV